MSDTPFENETEFDEPLSPEDELAQKKYRAFIDFTNPILRPSLESYFLNYHHDPANALREAFRLSFKFSNGSPFLQALLQAQVAQTLESVESAEVVADAARQITLDPSAFQPPHQHASGRAMKNADRRLPAIWDFYIDICANIEDLSGIAPRDKVGASAVRDLNEITRCGFLPVAITGVMAHAEQKYMEKGRPNRTTYEARYVSHLRTYGVLAKPTGNPEFDLVFSEVHATLKGLRYLPQDSYPYQIFVDSQSAVTELAGMWEEKHEEPFWPEPATADYQ